MEKNNPTPASLYASLFPLQASHFMKWIIVPEGDGKLISITIFSYRGRNSSQAHMAIQCNFL